MALMEVKGLTKRFGGLVANDNITFNIEEGEILGLIGPNGAGKTTLFNCLTGFLTPDEGQVVYQGSRIEGLPPHKISYLGIARTFQVTKTFPELTVLENVAIGALMRFPKVSDAMKAAGEVLDLWVLPRRPTSREGP